MEAGEPRAAQRPQYSNQNIYNHDQHHGREYSSYPRDPRDVRDQQDTRDPRDRTEPTPTSNMAAAALISPNTPYYSHYPQSAYAAGHYHQSPGHTHTQVHQAQPPSQSHQSHQSHPNHQAPGPAAPSAPGMISPVESRRTSDDHDMTATRQSLPSIQEVIGKNASPYPSAAGLPQPQASSSSSMQPQSSLPSPFATGAPPRLFSSETAADSQQSSPRTLNHAPPGPMYGSRPGTSFPEPLRPQPTGRSQPPGPHPSPPLPGIDSQERRFPPAPPPPHHLSQPSPHPHHSMQHPPPPPPPPSHPSQHPQQQYPGPAAPPHPQQQPPHPHPPHPAHAHEPVPPHHQPYHYGQGPPPPSHQRDGRPEHDSSPPPHHAYPPYPPPSVPQQQLPPPPGHSPYSGSPHHNGHSALPPPYEPMQDQGPDYNRPRTRYDDTVNRHFEAWSYAEYLARIGSNARTIFNFAEAFGSIAREEHGPQPMPGRMPSDREVVEMISNAEWLKTMLQNLRVMVQQTVVSERGPGSVNRQKPAGPDDMDIYNEPAQKPFALGEVKKRRGRAAPPGRCHSCNRIDTPEWRRGPDGARTLCNACGLHYAKLERKKQLENRQIRPKHPDEQRH